MGTLFDYFTRRGKQQLRLRISGHLKIVCNNAVVFDRHNLIVNEGKGWIMDWMASAGTSYDYTPLPLNAIVLTKHQSAENVGDTFAQTVFSSTYDALTHEGVLHVAGGGQVSITHVKGALNLTAVGTLAQAYGNDPTNNVINSVGFCSGTNVNYGGPGQGVYALTGNERLFARVNVGNLVKTVDKSYSFTWTITIQ